MTENKEEIRKKFHFQVFKKLVWGDPLSVEDRKIFVQWQSLCNPSMTFFNHYKNKKVLYEIVKYLKNNELCINENIRWLYSSKIEYLLKIIYFYKVLEYRGEKKGSPVEGMTFYCGLSNFTNREAPPFNIQEKKKWQDKWSGEGEYLKKIIGYDFGLDIDGKNFNEAYEDAKKVFNLLTKFKIRFSVWCSGRKGWHIKIPFDEFKHIVEPFDVDFTIAFCKGFMLDLVSLLKLKMVDTLIYSATRYLKTPYSLDMRNCRVIYPLSDEEFIKFNENMMTTEYLLTQKDLGNRGVYINRPSNPKGFDEMIKYIQEKLK